MFLTCKNPFTLQRYEARARIQGYLGPRLRTRSAHCESISSIGEAISQAGLPNGPEKLGAKMHSRLGFRVNHTPCPLPLPRWFGDHTPSDEKESIKAHGLKRQGTLTG